MAKNQIDVVVKGDYTDKDIKRAIGDLEKLQASSMSLGDKVSKMGDSIKGFGSQMTDVGKSLSMKVTLPILGIGAAAVATQATFETSMNQLAVATGAPSDALTELSDLAKQMGADTTFSANEAADAMLELAKGGFKPAQIAGGGVQATMALAATEGLALADSAVIVSNAMNTFGIKAAKAGKVADALAGGSIASSAGVSDLAQALAQVGPGATNAGLSLEQTVGALAAFADNGIKGSDAGTSLKTMLSRLVPQTDKAAGMMKRLGLDFTDAKGNIVPITEVARQLQTQLGGLSDAQRTTALNTIFGSDATRAATVLMKEGADGLAAYIDATTKQGSAQEMANARMKGTAGVIEQLKGSVETALLAIGEALAPMVQDVANFIKGFVDRFQQLSPAVQKAAVVFGVLAAAIGPVLIVAGMAVSGLGALIGAIGAISLPVVAVVAGIAAFVAAIVVLWNKSEAFRSAVMGIWEAIKTTVASVVNALKQKLDENRDALDTLRNAFSTVWEFLQSKVIPIVVQFYSNYLKNMIAVLGFVVERLIDVAGYMVTFAAGVINGIKAVAQFAQGVARHIGEAVAWFTQLPGRIAAAFSGAGTWLVDTGKNIVMGLLKGIGSVASTIGSWFLDKIPDWIKTPFKMALGIASPSKVFEGYGVNIIDGLIIGLGSKKEAVKERSKEIAQGVIDAGRDMISQWDTELDRLKGIYDSALNEFNSFRDGITGSIFGQLDLGAAIDAAKESGGSVVEAFQSQAAGIGQFAQNLIELTKTNLSEAAWTAVSKLSADRGVGLTNAMLGAQGQTIIDGVNKIYSDVDTMANAVGVLAANKWRGEGVKQAQATYEGFRDNFGEGGPARKALMNLMDGLSRAMDRTATITVTTVNRIVNEVIGPFGGARAMGGPVAANTAYLVGEKGPELFIPNGAGTILPNGDLPSTRMGSGVGAGSGVGNSYTINVQAGVGDPRAIGQQVVEYIKKFEKANGSVFVAA